MKTVLFVCTGNTCRSPMAACLLNAYCAERRLPLRAESAGLYAADGAPASDGALAVMKERGLSLGRHTARPVTRALVNDASLVLCMSEAHAAALRERFPGATTPIEALSPAVPDPYGGDAAAYRRAADALAALLPGVVRRLRG